MMSWESPWTVIFLIFISMASSSPTKRASYSAILLVQAKASLKEKQKDVFGAAVEANSAKSCGCGPVKVAISGGLLESRPVGRYQLDLLLLPGFPLTDPRPLDDFCDTHCISYYDSMSNHRAALLESAAG